MQRFVILLLIFSFLPAGGVLSLCTCELLDHGVFCEPVAPSCCAGKEEPAPDRHDDCACPTLEFSSLSALAESWAPAPASPTPSQLALAPVLDGARPAAPLPTVHEAIPPPASGPRLHLRLRVLRL